MAPRSRKTVTMKDRLMRLLNVRDEAAFEEAMSQPIEDDDDPISSEGGDTHIHVHTSGEGPKPAVAAVEDDDEELPDWFVQHVAENNARFDKLEQMISALGGAEKSEDDDEEVQKELAEETPEETHDRAFKAKDSVYLEDSFQETAALAEVIVPGISIPTFDTAVSPKKTLDQLFALRVRCLDLAYNQVETRELIDEALAGKTYDSRKMSRDSIRNLFRTVGALKKRLNNSNGRSSVSDVRAGGGTGVRGKIRNMKDYNNRMREIYEGASTH